MNPTRTAVRGAVMQRMRVAAERYMLLNEITSSPGEVELVAARWTEELMLSKMAEMPDIRQYDDPEIRAAMERLNTSVTAFLDELYAGLVSNAEPHLTVTS